MGILDGKTALVTGASAPNGIGRATARKLAQAGATVVVTDIDGEMRVDGHAVARADLLAELADGLGQGAFSLPLDVQDPDAVSETMARVIQVLGRIDILVNNAGSLAGVGDFLATNPEAWETSFRVNLLGPMLMIQAAVPHMRAQGGGRIINIGSTGSLGADAGFGAYTAMKHGLVGLTKTVAAEFGPDGILCNTVCPGFIRTDMHEAANARLAREQGCEIAQIRQQRYAQVALRDSGAPEDVAEAVVYLAGPGGNYVTGINLPVHGGVPVGL